MLEGTLQRGHPSTLAAVAPLTGARISMWRAGPNAVRVCVMDHISAQDLGDGADDALRTPMRVAASCERGRDWPGLFKRRPKWQARRLCVIEPRNSRTTRCRRWRRGLPGCNRATYAPRT